MKTYKDNEKDNRSLDTGSKNNIDNDFQDNSEEALQMQAFNENIQEADIHENHQQEDQLDLDQSEKTIQKIVSPPVGGDGNNGPSDLPNDDAINNMSGKNLDQLNTSYNAEQPKNISALGEVSQLQVIQKEEGEGNTSEANPQQSAETAANATGSAADGADQVSKTADEVGADGVSDAASDISAKLSEAEAKIKSVIPFLPSSVQWTTPEGGAFDPNAQPSGMVKATWTDIVLPKASNKKIIDKKIPALPTIPVFGPFGINIGGSLSATLKELKLGHVDVTFNFGDGSLAATGSIGASIGYMGSLSVAGAMPIDILPGILRLEPGVRGSISLKPENDAIQSTANWSVDLAKNNTISADATIPATTVQRNLKLDAYGKIIALGKDILNYEGNILDSGWVNTSMSLPPGDIKIALLLSDDPAQFSNIQLGDTKIEFKEVKNIKDYFKAKRKEARKDKSLKDAEEQAQEDGQEIDVEE
jgi:hypothetical protein